MTQRDETLADAMCKKPNTEHLLSQQNILGITLNCFKKLNEEEEKLFSCIGIHYTCYNILQSLLVNTTSAFCELWSCSKLIKGEVLSVKKKNILQCKLIFA